MPTDLNGTKELAKNLASRLKAGDVVALYGELGAGKTVFAAAIAAHFGFYDVTSPTYLLLNEYENERTAIYHFDLYRIEADDFISAGFCDYLFGEGICIIEWADKIDGMLPEGVIKVKIKKTGEDEREIEIL